MVNERLRGAKAQVEVEAEAECWLKLSSRKN
jgi:hypothetical protein